jgi:hypothetical protein
MAIETKPVFSVVRDHRHRFARVFGEPMGRTHDLDCRTVMGRKQIAAGENTDSHPLLRVVGRVGEE